MAHLGHFILILAIANYINSNIQSSARAQQPQSQSQLQSQEWTNTDIPNASYSENSTSIKLLDIRKSPVNMEVVYQEPGRLLLRGSVIKFSDFLNTTNQIRFNPSGQLRRIDIFATDTVIIDSDFKGQRMELQMTVIAPKWIITGTRHIYLCGAPGNGWQKARDGLWPWTKGQNGFAGLPGGSAGHFLGIGMAFSNINGLEVHANGGQGGQGQGGGNGAKGKDGVTAKPGDGRFRKVFLRDDKIITGFYNQIITQYHVYGIKGGEGGDGGDGGCGGFGGARGTVKFVDVGVFGAKVRATVDGRNGTAGQGGLGGLGGINGRDILAHYCKKWAFFIPAQSKWCWCKVLDDAGRAASGRKGADGSMTTGLRSGRPLAAHNIPLLLNDYKKYVLERMPQSTNLEQFLQQMCTHKELIRDYTTIDLVNEFIATYLYSRRC